MLLMRGYPHLKYVLVHNSSSYKCNRLVTDKRVPAAVKQ